MYLLEVAGLLLGEEFGTGDSVFGLRVVVRMWLVSSIASSFRFFDANDAEEVSASLWDPALNLNLSMFNRPLNDDVGDRVSLPGVSAMVWL